MSGDRSFRLAGETAFDWRRPASVLAVPSDIARSLYMQAMLRTVDVRLAEELYLRWLRAEAAKRQPDAHPVEPGAQTQVQALFDPGGRWDLQELAEVAPHKMTRVMLAFRERDALSATSRQKPAAPGRRTQVVETPSRPGFDDYRGLGLRQSCSGWDVTTHCGGSSLPRLPRGSVPSPGARRTGSSRCRARRRATRRRAARPCGTRPSATP